MGNTQSTPSAPPTQMSQEGIDFLKYQEGFKGEFSQDGKSAKSGQSIAYGINCKSNPKTWAQIKEQLQKTGEPLSKEQGEAYLKQILPQYENAVKGLDSSDTLSKNEFDALVRYVEYSLHRWFIYYDLDFGPVGPQGLAYHKGGKGMSRTVNEHMKMQDKAGVYRAIKNDQTTSKGGETYAKRRLEEAELFKSSEGYKATKND